MWIIYELLIRWRVRSANKNFPDAHDTVCTVTCETWYARSDFYAQVFPGWKHADFEDTRHYKLTFCLKLLNYKCLRCSCCSHCIRLKLNYSLLMTASASYSSFIEINPVSRMHEHAHVHERQDAVEFVCMNAFLIFQSVPSSLSNTQQTEMEARDVASNKMRYFPR